jgi:hypothetical protein
MSICVWLILGSVALWVIGGIVLFLFSRKERSTFAYLGITVLAILWSAICALGILVPSVILLVQWLRN